MCAFRVFFKPGPGYVVRDICGGIAFRAHPYQEAMAKHISVFAIQLPPTEQRHRQLYDSVAVFILAAALAQLLAHLGPVGLGDPALLRSGKNAIVPVGRQLAETIER